MSTLMSFILDTLLPCVNDPKNDKLWLPKLLTGMIGEDGNPALPIRSDFQDLGDIVGDDGEYVAERFADTWAIMNEEDAEPNPDDRYPHMILSDIVLAGVQNVFVDQSASTPNTKGYTVGVPLMFNHYDAPQSGVPMSLLTLSGHYRIDQSLLVGSPPDTSVTSITGEGKFTVEFSDCRLDAQASVAIAGSGKTRSPSIIVKALLLSGTKGTEPTLDFTELTLDGDLAQKDLLIAAIQEALNDPEGQGAIVDAVSSMLNSPTNLDSVNTMLSGQSSDIMSDIFGPLPPEGLPDDDDGQQAATPVDLYLFDRVRVALSQPDSNWFLPWQLASSSDPVLEPYTNPQIDVPDQTIKGLKYTNIQLTDLVLAGGANAQAPLPAVVLASPRITATLNFGVWAQGPEREVPRQGGAVIMAIPPAPPATITNHFSLIQQGFKPVPLKGSMTATISGLKGSLSITPSGKDVNDLYLTLSDISTNLSDAKIDLSVQLDPRDETLEKIITTMFEKPDVQSQIASVFTQALSDQEQQLSDEFSQIARTSILDQING